MGTRASLSPLAAEFPASNFPALMTVNARPVLAYDASTKETAYWTLLVPQGWTGTKTAVITYMMASATSGGVAFDVALEAVTDGDATDLDAGTSFGSDNTANETVPGTAGHISQVTVTLTNDDGAAAADYLRLSLARDPADAADTATGDCYVLGVEIRDGA